MIGIASKAPYLAWPEPTSWARGTGPPSPSSHPGPWSWSQWGWGGQQPSGRCGCSRWWWNSCSPTWTSCSATLSPLLALTLQVCPSTPDVLTTAPSLSGLQREGRWAPSPIPIPLKLDLPSGSLRTPPRPLPPLPPLLISAPTLRIPTSWPGHRSSFTPCSSWGRSGPWVHLGGGGRSPDLTPPQPHPDSPPCPGPQPSQDSARRRALWLEVTEARAAVLAGCWELPPHQLVLPHASSSPACCPPVPA